MARPHTCPACTGPSVVIPHATIPNAAEVSATVARQWHLGLAEDADRRQRPWRIVAFFARNLLGEPNERAEKVADYFEHLAATHHNAAEEGLTP